MARRAYLVAAREERPLAVFLDLYGLLNLYHHLLIYHEPASGQQLS